MPALVLLDDELDLTRGGCGGGHRERSMLVGPRNGDIGVLPRFELEFLRRDQSQPERDDVVRQRLQVSYPHPQLLQRNGVAKYLLVVVDQLDLGIAVDVRLAQEDVSLFALVVGECESRVTVHLYIALDEERFARRALTFAATVHQGDALAESGVQHGFRLFDLHLEVNRFELDAVGFTHEVGSWSGSVHEGWGAPGARSRVPARGGRRPPAEPASLDHDAAKTLCSALVRPPGPPAL